VRIIRHVEDAHFAPRVLHRVGGVRGVDHDVGAELAADGTGARLGRIGGTQNLADLGHRLKAFVHDREALLGAGQGALLGQAVRRAASGHELHDVFELAVGEERRQRVAQAVERRGVHRESELARQRLRGAVRREFLEDFLEALAHRPVELLGLRHRHGEFLHAHDAQPGVREQVHDVAGAQRRLVPVVRLEHHQRLLRVDAARHVQRAAHDAGLRRQMRQPHAEDVADDLTGRADQHRRFKILDPAGCRIAHQVAVGVAHALAAAPLLADGAGDLEDLADGVLALEEQQHRAVRASGRGVRRVDAPHIGRKERALFRIAGIVGFQIGRELLGQFGRGPDDARADQFQVGAHQVACDNAAGPRFADRIRINDDERQFLRHV